MDLFWFSVINALPPQVKQDIIHSYNVRANWVELMINILAAVQVSYRVLSLSVYYVSDIFLLAVSFVPWYTKLGSIPRFGRCTPDSSHLVAVGNVGYWYQQESQ